MKQLCTVLVLVAYLGVASCMYDVAGANFQGLSSIDTVPSYSQLPRRTDVHHNAIKRAVDISVRTWTFFGQTPDEMSSMLDLHSARLITIRAEDPSIPTFSGSMVANTGAYSSTWWWYYDVDPVALGNLLDGRTLVSLDPYQNPSGLVFAAIMAPNVGTQAISWWWYHGFDVSGVNGRLVSNNARLISARPYQANNQVLYAVVMVSNAVNPKRWQWLSGQSITNITSTMNANQQRVLSLALNPGGGWDVVLVATTGEIWWWWTDLDSTAVANSLSTHNSLLVDLTSYLENGVRQYAGIELGDSTSNSTSQSSPTQSALTSSIPSSSPSSSSNHSISTQTRIIIIGSVCGGIATVFIVLILVVLLCRGRNGSKASSKSHRITPSNKVLSSPSSPSTATSNTATTSGPPNSQPAQPVTPPTFQTASQPLWPAGPSKAGPSSYQYGYVPPTDAIFNVT